jgi:hypothetical protein
MCAQLGLKHAAPSSSSEHIVIADPRRGVRRHSNKRTAGLELASMELHTRETSSVALSRHAHDASGLYRCCCGKPATFLVLEYDQMDGSWKEMRRGC